MYRCRCPRSIRAPHQDSERGWAGTDVTAVQRDFADVISNTGSVKLISRYRRLGRFERAGALTQAGEEEEEEELIASDRTKVRRTERGITRNHVGIAKRMPDGICCRFRLPSLISSEKYGSGID